MTTIPVRAAFSAALAVTLLIFAGCTGTSGEPCGGNCGFNATCIDNQCVPTDECTTNEDCPGGGLCIAGSCLSTGSCATDDDCGETQVCDEGFCTSVGQ